MEAVESAHLRILKTLSYFLPAEDDDAAWERYLAGVKLELVRSSLNSLKSSNILSRFTLDRLSGVHK